MFLNTDFLKNDELVLRLERTSDAVPEKEWLAAYYFSICLADGTPVGRCDLRIGHNTSVYYGGNIGYWVDEMHRGHHYAAKACKLLFQLARKHEMTYLYITCNVSNIASAKTCERAGGEYIATETLPEDNDMYMDGVRQVKVYKFELR